MATAADVRRIALSLEGTIEVPHADRSAFRVRRIYTTLAPDGRTINMDLTPDEQTFKVMMAPNIYSRIPNGWGLRGATTIDLEKISVTELESALRMAWEHGRAKEPIHRKKV
jgi:hypothetical protein